VPEPAAAREREPAGGDAAGAALRTVADRLTAHGFDILVPAEQEPCQLFLTNVRGALCQLDFTSSRKMVWVHQPFYGASVSPEGIAGMVMALLGITRTTGHGLPTKLCPGLGLKGVVGQVLTACGLHVRLEVTYRDDMNYEIYAAVEVTNPAEPARGHVQVGDDAAIRWECGVGDPTTGTSGLPPADVAQVIAQALEGHGG